MGKEIYNMDKAMKEFPALELGTMSIPVGNVKTIMKKQVRWYHELTLRPCNQFAKMEFFFAPKRF